jgi:magnesium transporter
VTGETVMMIVNLLTPEIKDLIEKKDWINLKNSISDWPSPDIADLIGYLGVDESRILFRLLPKSSASDVFAKLDSVKQEELLNRIGNSEIRDLLINTSYDDRTDLSEDLPGILTRKILNILPDAERKKSLELLGYPQGSVGRLMTPDYIAVKSDWKVDRALEHIRLRGRDAETADIIYVVDQEWILLDDIPLRRFVFSNPEHTVERMMDRAVISIDAKQDQEEAYQLIKRYDLTVLAVVDDEGILLGIVTVDDIIDVLEEEVTEDFHKSSAINPVEQNYAFAGAFLLYKKRIGWLLNAGYYFLGESAGFPAADPVNQI